MVSHHISSQLASPLIQSYPIIHPPSLRGPFHLIQSWPTQYPIPSHPITFHLIPSLPSNSTPPLYQKQGTTSIATPQKRGTTSIATTTSIPGFRVLMSSGKCRLDQ